MPLSNAFAQASTVLLSAGPGAGKTAFLAALQAAAPERALLLQLTPEDGDPAFLLHRVLKRHPGIGTAFARLQQDFPAIAPGALLGQAIEELLPEASLLVDDFHLVEATPAAELLLGLFRHLPPSARLAVTSRHRLPTIHRAPSLILGEDTNDWVARPAAEDVRSLPEDLGEAFAALGLLGEAAPTPSNLELVRRNIAVETEGRAIVLRPAWKALSHLSGLDSLPRPVWDVVASGVEWLFERHFRTGKEEAIERALALIPSDEKLATPALVRIEAELLDATGRHQEALLLLESARQRGIDEEGVATLHLELRFRHHPKASSSAELAEEASRIGPLSPLGKARICYVRGMAAFNLRADADAFAAWEDGLSVNVATDRQSAYLRFKILRAMFVASNVSEHFGRSLRNGDMLTSLIDAYGFDRLRLSVYSLHFHLKAHTDAAGELQQRFFDIPPAIVAQADQHRLISLFMLLGHRLIDIGEYALAQRFFRHLALISQAKGLANVERHVTYGAVMSTGYLGDLARAQGMLEVILGDESDRRTADIAVFQWASMLIETGRIDLACEFLEANRTSVRSESVRDKFVFLDAVLRHRAGEKEAQASIRELLKEPRFQPYWTTETRLLQLAGILPAKPIILIHGFGDLSLMRDGEAIAKWPRRKSLHLLGILALDSDGLDIESLIQELFGDAPQVDALDSLHTVIYSLRQALSTIGAGHLIEAAPGLYRLKWDEIAFFDVAEFERWYTQARRLEDVGSREMASIFFSIALLYAPQSLFTNLAGNFAAERAVLDRKIRHASDFMQNNHSWLIPLPQLVQ